MRRLLRALRHLPDRLAHDRRRAAAARLVAAAGPTRIIVGCLGNICRSPYAAARLRVAGLPLAIDSAGFIGPGRSPPPEAIDTALARGVDVSGHRSRQFQATDLEAGTLIVVMEVGHARRLLAEMGGPGAATIVVLGDFDPEPIASRAIPDPFGRSMSMFAACFDRIDRCLAALIKTLPETRDQLAGGS